MLLSFLKNARRTWSCGKTALEKEGLALVKFKKYVEIATEIAARDKSQLQTLVNYIARETQAELFSQMTLKKITPYFKKGEPHELLFLDYAAIDDSGNKINSFFVQERIENSPLPLADYIFLPWPWNYKSLVECFFSIGTQDHPWKFDEMNHRVTFYLPFKVGFLYGGNHSIATGIVKGIGSIDKYDQVDLSKIYDHIYCDGEFYRRRCDGRPLQRVPDLPMAAVFEIGRLMLP